MAKHQITVAQKSATELSQSRRSVRPETPFRDLAYSREEIKAAEDAWEQAFNEGR